MPDLINIIGVMYVVMYCFAIAGMTLFSDMILNDSGGGPSVNHHTNFNNIYVAMQTVFQLVTGDSWSGVYLDTREVRYPADKYQLSASWVNVYFIAIMFTMLILTAVFVAIIIKNYSIQRSLTIDQARPRAVEPCKCTERGLQPYGGARNRT